MSSSLQDQLLKAGLVTEEQVEESRRLEEAQRKEARARERARAPGKGGRGRDRNQGRGQGAGERTREGRGAEPRGGRRGAQDRRGQGRGAAQGPGAQGPGAQGPGAQGRPVEAGKGDAARRPPPADKKRLRQRVRALLERRAITAPGGEIPYNFLRGKRVKRLYVDEPLRARLVSGEVLIAEVYGLHHVLDESALAEVLALLPETFVHRHGQAEAGDGQGDAPGAAESGADDYAGFEVPDDLVW